MKDDIKNQSMFAWEQVDRGFSDIEIQNALDGSGGCDYFLVVDVDLQAVAKFISIGTHLAFLLVSWVCLEKIFRFAR